MPDTFAITVLFIILSAVIGAFIRGRSKDKCLKNFDGNVITVVGNDGETSAGTLSVESTGFELEYRKPEEKRGVYVETSRIIYKNEYGLIQTIIRFHDELSEKEKIRRNKNLKKTYHPNIFRRTGRKIRNFFSTVKDSLMEVINMVIGSAEKMNKFGGVISSQNKYISQMKQGVVETVSTSFEPLLEKHIGKKVVVELRKGENVIKYTGILKDYTSLFIEIMDVASKKTKEGPPKTADLLIPRALGRVRHLGE